jgi:transcriptional regulator with XRE-family HTH domain
MLRTWRRRRRISQDDLALDAEMSRKRLSELESARTCPTRPMVLSLAACLDIPLRDRNYMLAAAGYDPEFPERRFTEADFAVVRRDVEALLAAHQPSPAAAIDRHWTVLAANPAIERLLVGAESALLRQPLNLLRLCLHPAGIASRIVNLSAWRAHLIARLQRQICASGDPVLIELLDEIRDYPSAGGHAATAADDEVDSLAVPLRLATLDGVLTFLGATTTFAAPTDITLAEISIEAFLPGDARTAAMLRAPVR